jgi:hypothetical protein
VLTRGRQLSLKDNLDPQIRSVLQQTTDFLKDIKQNKLTKAN